MSLRPSVTPRYSNGGNPELRNRGSRPALWDRRPDAERRRQTWTPANRSFRAPAPSNRRRSYNSASGRCKTICPPATETASEPSSGRTPGLVDGPRGETVVLEIKQEPEIGGEARHDQPPPNLRIRDPPQQQSHRNRRRWKPAATSRRVLANTCRSSSWPPSSSSHRHRSGMLENAWQDRREKDQERNESNRTASRQPYTGGPALLERGPPVTLKKSVSEQW